MTIGVQLEHRPGIALPLRKGQSANWLLAFVVFEIVCQLALLSSAIGSARILVRSAAFGGSLLLLFWLRSTGARHPSSRVALAIFLILGVSFFNPSTNSVMAGLAQTALYIAVLAPVFWVTRLTIDLSVFRKLLLILWIFQSCSSAVGALQAYFPGEFQPALSSNYDENALQIILNTGESIYRPMGLTDMPGGAGSAGFYTVLLGIGILLDRPKAWLRPIVIGSMLLGMFALYLSQIRSLLVMLAVCVATIAFLLAQQGRLVRSGALIGTIAGVVLGAFSLAVGVAGDSVTGRLTTLIEQDPGDVYYANRGKFLEQTLVELLPQYPFGAGLGRYGMMYAYFGDTTKPDIWVEIQWTGWLIDGGIALVVVYFAVLLLALWFALRVATRRVGAQVDGLWLWGVVLVGYDMGAIALTFNYALFMGTLGLEFWMLNAALFTAAHSAPRLAES